MDITALRMYAQLCRNLHFGKTSDEFHISPSALSRMIQRLEAEVGHQLLLRDNRSVRLTRQGEIFEQFARDGIDRFEQLQVDLGLSEQRLMGKLTLFASVTASQSILPNVLARFREVYPAIQIQLETGYAVNALQRLREGCDVVVAALPDVTDDQLVKRIVLTTAILTVAPLNAGNLPGIDGDSVDWNRVPLVLPSRGQARDNIDDWLRTEGIKPTIYSEVAGNEATLSLVALGCGVGFVPALVLESSPLADKVRILANGPALSDFRVGFCTRKRNLAASPLIRAFWASI
jgi:LysR family transcriptional regulator, positive regulator for ilvC